MADLANEQKFMDVLKNEHLALALLQLLQREASYRLNNRIALEWGRHIALASTAADIGQCAAKLEVKGLIKIETVDELQVFTLTNAGENVALGRSVVEGVLRPCPDCSY